MHLNLMFEDWSTRSHKQAISLQHLGSGAGHATLPHMKAIGVPRKVASLFYSKETQSDRQKC